MWWSLRSYLRLVYDFNGSDAFLKIAGELWGGFIVSLIILLFDEKDWLLGFKLIAFWIFLDYGFSFEAESDFFLNIESVFVCEFNEYTDGTRADKVKSGTLN